MLGDETRAGFETAGYAVLRGWFDPTPLADELDRALARGVRSGPAIPGGGDIGFRFVPMMCEETPVSLALVDALAAPAAELLGRAVVPVRAKGTRYLGSSALHSDSELGVPSVGFLAYLESLDAGNGALRIQPGSHRRDPSGSESDAEPIETQPGDVIAFDEHVTHGSAGGRDRRQWRVDFVVDPVGAEETALVREYFARIYVAGWDGGYDTELFPSYDTRWQTARRPWTERMRELGAYDLAAAQERAMRAHHSQ